MQTNEQRSAERVERLSHSVNVAAKLRPLVDDLDVKAHLDAIEGAMIEDLIKATAPDRQGQIAAEIRAWRKVRAAIASLAHGGKHSLQKLNQMSKEMTNGE